MVSVGFIRDPQVVPQYWQPESFKRPIEPRLNTITHTDTATVLLYFLVNFVLGMLRLWRKTWKNVEENSTAGPSQQSEHILHSSTPSESLPPGSLKRAGVDLAGDPSFGPPPPKRLKVGSLQGPETFSRTHFEGDDSPFGIAPTAETPFEAFGTQALKHATKSNGT